MKTTPQNEQQTFSSLTQMLGQMTKDEKRQLLQFLKGTIEKREPQKGVS